VTQRVGAHARQLRELTRTQRTIGHGSALSYGE
jgi:hypothetical protein